MTHIVSIEELRTYCPTFNTSTGKYQDSEPWENPLAHNKARYNCPCQNRGFIFNRCLPFRQHIKTSSHKTWLANFTDSCQNADLHKQLKEMRVAHGKSEQENIKLKNKLAKRDKKIEGLEEQLKRCEERCKQLVDEGYWSCTSDEME